MRLFVFVIFASLFNFSTAFGGNTSEQGIRGISQKRAPQEDWQEAMANSMAKVLSTQPSAKFSSARSEAVPFDEVDWNKVPAWTGTTDIPTTFNHVRDLRFLDDPDKDSFLRRISWLFPDDGCFARAGLVKEVIFNREATLASRIFIFGNLSVKTDNHPEGSVSWWYHTAFVGRGENGEIFVFDPALQPSAPMLVKDWVLAQVPETSEATISLCHVDTYDPSSDCNRPRSSKENAMWDIPYYLSYERARQVQLGRDADEVLGENPPWRQPVHFLLINGAMTN